MSTPYAIRRKPQRRDSRRTDASSVARIAGGMPSATHTRRRCDRAPRRSAGCANPPGMPRKFVQVELADPEHVDTRHRRDRLDVFKTLVGLDLHDDQRALVKAAIFCADVAALIVVAVRIRTRRRAGPRADNGCRRRSRAPGRPSRPSESSRRGADVEGPGNAGVLASGHAHHRNDREPAAQANCHFSVSKPSPVCSMS